MLEECELPYKMIPVDVWKGDQFSPEFTKINPNQKIPAIVDHDGPGGQPITIIESGAILQYLGEKTGKFIRVGPAMAGAANEETIEVWEKDTSTQAFTDLLNRALDKPAEQVRVTGEEGGPVGHVFRGQQ